MVNEYKTQARQQSTSQKVYNIFLIYSWHINIYMYIYLGKINLCVIVINEQI